MNWDFMTADMFELFLSLGKVFIGFIVANLRFTSQRKITFPNTKIFVSRISLSPGLIMTFDIVSSEIL